MTAQTDALLRSARLQLSRPVRRPSDREARIGWAKVLSRGDMDKARRIVRIPLMDVLLEGRDAVFPRRN